MEFIGIIPARYASTRFPGKPLAMLGGKRVIERVYEQAAQALNTVVVATDDDRIIRAVHAFGGNAVLTRADHHSGTDRSNEAYHTFGHTADVIINIQGDEPFIQPAQIRALMSCFDNNCTDIATLIKPYDPETPYAVLADPNTVKCVTAPDGRALYFSRSVIPYLRGEEPDQWAGLRTYYKHIGIYAYRAEVLERITGLERTPLERTESLEQLRWLENGLTIRTAVTDIETIGIDTPADLAEAEKFLTRRDADNR